MIVGTAVALGVGKRCVRVVFWVGLALLCAWSIWTSVAMILVIVAILVAAALLSGDGRRVLAGCRAALADGARQALPVGLACALVGVVIGVMTLTGLGTIIGTSLISIGRDSIFAALVLTDDLQPDPRHGDPDHSELHHHIFAGRAHPASSSMSS
jgi:hypothetical protein